MVFLRSSFRTFSSLKIPVLFPSESDEITIFMESSFIRCPICVSAVCASMNRMMRLRIMVFDSLIAQLCSSNMFSALLIFNYEYAESLRHLK